jgi:hypothetical protein
MMCLAKRLALLWILDCTRSHMKNFTRDGEKLCQTKPAKGADTAPFMHVAYSLATERSPVQHLK